VWSVKSVLEVNVFGLVACLHKMRSVYCVGCTVR
jgi:hypothetical protein